MEKVMVDAGVLGIKAESIPVHFTRQEIAALLASLEAATPEVLEKYLTENRGWDQSKVAGYINGHMAARVNLINRLGFVVILEGG